MMSWRIFQRWFNVAPQANSKYITDKFGKKFWIYWDAERFECVADLHVIYRGRWVGLINSWREKDRSITLVDMMVLEGNELRKRGLGKAMLQEFIRWAQANNFKRIRGLIEPHDGSTVEYLTEWYKRQGFKVKDRQIFFELQRKIP
jgi:GNAT superfamily N-acetyltransferase